MLCKMKIIIDIIKEDKGWEMVYICTSKNINWLVAEVNSIDEAKSLSKSLCKDLIEINFENKYNIPMNDDQKRVLDIIDFEYNIV